ncbi:MAG TPA: sialate O-acetylesterase [Bacteroidales bacterium]|nr:sialate O-acetylesterase [Bacteroidales bacterium]
MNKAFKGLLLIGLLIACMPGYALVKPVNLFSEHMVLQRNKPIPVWGTGTPGEKVTVLFNNLKAIAKTNKSGKWMVKLKALPEGGPYNMEVRGKKNSVLIKDVYVGEVWVCSGQSNMDMTVAKEDRYWCGVEHEAEEVAGANYPKIRVFDVEYTPNNEIQKDVVGKWEVCSPKTVGHFSAAAYFFAKNLYDQYEIPFGLITSAYGASTAECWISEKSLREHPKLNYLLDNYQAKWDKFAADSAKTMAAYRSQMAKYSGDLAALAASAGDVSAKKPKAPKNPDPSIDQHNPYVCYNGMIAPLFPYAIRGVLWYQGESNGPSANDYREIMETLIADWRKSFGQGDFPFIYVQLANYGKPMSKPVEDGPMMTVREAQLQNLSVPNTAMVVAIDNASDASNIHPKNKQEIGFRLALCAMNKAYGESLEYSGPMYDHYLVKGGSIQLFFKPNQEDFVAWCDKLTGFAIAGEDKVFHWAQAKFEGKTIVVWNPAVPKPVAVRYCWGTNPPASLANKDGLWAPNFRTDNW